jgi:crotonobetainyl-CoA:carnitine CoA-transferase CaiB-like acyl-CoA transferase
MSGFASMNGFADREPVLPPMYLADGVAGLYGAAAAMIGLREVEQNGGHGQVIDLPLLDPLFTILGPQAANYRLTGKPKPRTGSRSSNSAPRNVYKCKDGTYVALSASTEKMAKRLFDAIGRPDLLEDSRFRTNADRVTHAEELDALVGAFIVQRTQAENVAFFETAEVTIGPVYDVSQVLEDPQVIERELLSDYPDSEMGNLPMHHPAARFFRTPASIRKPAPSLGEHNRELLRELGLGDTAYEELLRLGVAAEGDPQPQAIQNEP